MKIPMKQLKSSSQRSFGSLANRQTPLDSGHIRRPQHHHPTTTPRRCARPLAVALGAWIRSDFLKLFIS